MNEKLLTIIVTFNGMKWIDKCIQSVLSSTMQSDIIVIDNASTDETPNFIKQNFPTVHLTCSNKNLGFGAANNIGLQYAIDNNYGYVYLLNQDAWVKKDTFEKIILTQKKHSDYGILSPIQLEANELHFDYNFGSIISQWNKETKACEDFFFGRKNEVMSIPRIMAAHWLISRDCLINVGGFSPAFFHYGEDNNYADRAWKKGFKVGIASNATGIHDRENRPISEQKKALLNFCTMISNFSSFKFSKKEILWNYSYETLLKIFTSHQCFIYSIRYYIKFILNLHRFSRYKNESMAKGAFLNIGQERCLL